MLSSAELHSLRAALPRFVDAGTLELTLHPLLCAEDLAVALCGEEDGFVWLGCRRSETLVELLRCSRSVRVQLVKHGWRLLLEGKGKAELDRALVARFDSTELRATLGLDLAQRMLLRVEVQRAELQQLPREHEAGEDPERHAHDESLLPWL